MTDTTAAPTTPVTVGAPAGHDAAMAAKFDAAQAAASGTAPATPEAPTATPERPAGLPAEFKDMAEFEAAYKALKGETANPAGDTKSPDLKVPEAAPETSEDATKLLADKGLDFAAYQARWAEKGEVSKEDYESLAKAGIPKELVDGYVAGQQARATGIRDGIFKDVGGEEKYGEMVQWAATGLTKDEQVAYNDLVSSGDLAKVRMAVMGLQARHTAAVGSAPKLLAGETAPSVGDVYESIAQMKADMNDPKYRADPAFRAKVSAKLARSSIL